MDGEFDLFPHQIRYIFFGKIFSKSNQNIYSELVIQLLDWLVPLQIIDEWQIQNSEHNLDAALNHFLKRRPIWDLRLDGSAVEESHNLESDNSSR